MFKVNVTTGGETTIPMINRYDTVEEAVEFIADVVSMYEMPENSEWLFSDDGNDATLYRYDEEVVRLEAVPAIELVEQS